MDNDKTVTKEEWEMPEVNIIPFKNTGGGENPTDNEDTAGEGYDPTPS